MERNHCQGARSGLWAVVLACFFLIGGLWGPKAAAEQMAAAEAAEPPVIAETIKFENPEVKLEANQITMDSNLKLIQARGRVRLLVKESNLRFETEELDYDITAQVVKIPGQVRFISETAVLLVNTLTYNVKTLEGQGGALEGTIEGNLASSSRKVSVDGRQFETEGAGEKITITGAALTRCPKPKPDYAFKASKIIITKIQVSLTHVFLYFEGIPIFYLPSFSFRPGDGDNANFPDIEEGLRYDPNQGLALDYALDIPINDQSDFLVKGSFSQGDDSSLGVGYGFQVGDLTNKSYLIKYFEKGWVFEDKLRFVIGGFTTTLAAFHNFGTEENGESAENGANLLITKDFKTLSLNVDGLYNSMESEHQLGFNLTRKYWKGWLGDWQLGVQARQVSKDDDGVEVGGIYGGYRLDYRPIQNLTVSYLWLDSFSDPLKYGAFDPNLGSSALYQVNVPVTKNLSFSLGGSYNLTGGEWKSQSYGLTYDTCCYAITFQWDTVTDTWRNLQMRFKF